MVYNEPNGLINKVVAKTFPLQRCYKLMGEALQKQHQKHLIRQQNGFLLTLEVEERRLIAALKDGELSAFNYLYHHYAANLFGVIFKIVKQQETAEDVLQELFLKIKSNIHAYNEKKGRLFTWMLNMARNAAIDEVRRASSKGRLLCDELEYSLGILDREKSTILNPDTIGLKKLLNQLKENETMLIDLVYYQGYTHQEIAESLNIPIGTVKTRIRNAIFTLRAIFAI